VVVALLAMRTSELHRRERAAKARGQVREALRYVRRTPELRLPLLLMAVVFTLSFNFSVLVPLLAVRAFHGDAGTFGGLLALMGVGSLVGALAMASRSSGSTPARLAWFAVALGLASLLLALAPTLALAWLVVLLTGAAAIGFMITGNSTLQLRSAEELRGRVMALYTVVFIGSTPIGGPIAGAVGEHLGPRVGLAGGGIIAVLAGLWALARASGSMMVPP
jgi:predicted MFS family arabinose efflux permease